MVVYSVLKGLLMVETCAVCNIFSNNVKKQKGTVVWFFVFFFKKITYVSLFFVHIAAPGHAQICMSLKEEEKNKKETKNLQYWHKNKK